MTVHIHISGQVQGVGFRPFIYRLAVQKNLKGWVSNGNDGVHAEVSGTPEEIESFYHNILWQKPVLAKITRSSYKEVHEKNFQNFEIRESDKNTQPNLLLTPDVAMCAECRREIHNKKDRRYAYPFTTCTNCGVRYSIIEALPYDRENTSMKNFIQCTDCQLEYNNPLDRRYFSQTNSCALCGVDMKLYEAHSDTYIFENILQKVVEFWKEGKIVAIKNLGGYLLTCDATNADTINQLRKRKKRPCKPFALMYPSVEILEKDVILHSEGLKFLQSPESPIVLLETKDKMESGIAKQAIAPHLSFLGVMLPHSPLFSLLLADFEQAIIATSGNLSNSPIIFEDDKAITDLSTVADYILTHNRSICVPQDDSVASFNYFDNQPIILRRARGLAPTFIQKDLKVSEQTILAMGAMMKSSFALAHQKNVYISQYLGDLESYETQENYKLVLTHFLKLFKTKPEKIIIDKHPDYFSTQFGKELAENEGIEIKEVQHHLAHFAAVLAENNLIASPENEAILGIIWDGTGLGEDGNIWGGEFFVFDNQCFHRVSHFPYFPMIARDKMPKEPRISALCSFGNIENIKQVLETKFTKTEWQVYQNLISKPKVQTSSIGRLFDATASLLGILDKASYEGEAAMLIENVAFRYYKKISIFELSILESLNLPLEAILQEIVQDWQAKKDIGFIALKFHYLLVHQIKKISQQLNIKKIAFSGGVFQNALLVMLIKKYLQDFDLYFHKQLSPNDENIAFGQIILSSFI
ncbi:carbamoyltransferase HypF [Thermoflexibacter ruber]|uniref:Carbamoyltransferase n=1 Tax=Thermoflexibacter ruber TaxID=1003 RepID=A0A1I2B0Q4_9BACT|nr:carbamoyltransferase HypF [Thermoflexibacter ruber]SFE49478.1 Hydrogenase maturation protein, carbamoyltransferase HypF [Thermoflexibacter ruber]